jgi:hypothetical protein
LFPPVLILFDHPIGVTGLSIDQQSGAVQRMCEMEQNRLARVIIRGRRMIQYAAAPIFYAVASDYWMPAFAGMTLV